MAKQTNAEMMAGLAERNVLFGYQKDWIRDRSKYKICNKARQIGISLMMGLEGCMDVADGEPVFYVSRTERQSIYLLEKFYKWADFFVTAGLLPQYELRSRTECRINGVDVKSLTSEAVAGEGFSGNVYLDEFGLHDNDIQIYRSLFPVTTWGYKMRIVSRPFGQNNLFYKIFTDEKEYPNYHRFEFDIYRAIADGAPHNLDELKKGLDEDGFAENYECRFIDESTTYFPYELLRANIAEPSDGNGEHYLGVDVGYNRDRTIIYVVRKLGDTFSTVLYEDVVASTFDERREAIRSAVQRYNIQAGAIDATGLGAQLGEEINEEFPNIQNIWFTNSLKDEMATRTKRLLEQRKFSIPDDDILINDFHSIRMQRTKSGNVVFDATRTQHGHGDRFWAANLAIHASQEEQAEVRIY